MSKIDLHLGGNFALQSELEPLADEGRAGLIRIRVGGLNPRRFYRLSGYAGTFFRADQSGVVELLFFAAAEVAVDLVSVV